MAKSPPVSAETGAVQPNWLSPADAATYLGITTPTLYERVMDKVEVRKMGRKTLIKRADLDRYMETLPAMPARGLRLTRHPQYKAPAPMADASRRRR